MWRRIDAAARLAPIPTIRLATPEDMRLITSQNLERIHLLPHLYIATDDPTICKSWGVAGQISDHGENTVVSAERLYPGTLVAPRYAGDRPLRADLEDMGAEPAEAFTPQL